MNIPSEIITIGLGIVALVVVVLGLLVIVARFYRQVDQGKALIANTLKSEPVVTFTGMVVYPVIHRAEVMDISVKTIEIDRRGKEGLICKDNIRGDIKVTFFVRVNKTQDDVLKVAQSIGCVRASDPLTLQELFTAKFSEALKTVGKRMNFEDLYKERQRFKDDIIDVIGKDLNGFVLDDAAIDYLEQTPIETLDKDNIMDAEGIRKITELTVNQNVATNELRQKERMEMGSQNLNADEAVFRFDQRRAEAEAKKSKEIAISQAREQNEAARIAGEENKRTMLLNEKNQEEVLVAREARERGVAVAAKNKEREIAVETERVEKARALEAVSREREVEIQRIQKEKEIETQKKDIADVVRARIAVDRTVAEEEERIKDLRSNADAIRKKDTMKTEAEAKAEAGLVTHVKQAQADEEVAKFKARERLVTADAELESADKHAKAKIRMAEGVQAEHAAEGLAGVRVKEAAAAAIEKTGLVEAKVHLEKMQAEAQGLEKQGLAKAKVREAEAQAIEKQGLAEALVSKEKLGAEAQGIEQKGLAHARAQEAEANALKTRLFAEAAGTAEKANAMKALDGAGREHEEFRLELEKNKEIALEQIHMRKEVALAQAEVLAKSFANAKIQIVGGDGAFFDRFVKAMSLGQSIDTTLENSHTLQAALADYTNGKRSAVEDVKDILSRPALGPGGVQSLTLSALLAKLLAGSDAQSKRKLERLGQAVGELGLGDVEVVNKDG